mmetsp:Transcript_773/g.1470  ORF Transcript_773/g.1470 Transcript_773/m.1470 type:complete len:477 (+) Transcript_773:38-1468(+)
MARLAWLAWLAICLPFLPLLPLVAAEARLNPVRESVQEVLDEMSIKYNMSFSFGYVDGKGRVGVAAGLDDIFRKTRLSPDSLIPLGSVTKSWTAVMTMQAVERGSLALDDPANKWIDPVLSRLWKTTMEDLWGKQAEQVRVRDLLGMTSGFNDYDDFFLEHFTLAFSADDAGPLIYLRSSAKYGFLCAPGTCAAYSGANYVLLGLVLVQVHGMWSWQDLYQLSVIPSKLFATGRYSRTSFLNLGRCSQYPGVAHQYAWQYWGNKSNMQQFKDLYANSCLNGWTMGNIASSAKDLATFFYDLFTLPVEDGGFLTNSSLQEMKKMKRLSDNWCFGPTGAGSCKYGMGILTDQVGQDVWPLQDPSQAEAVRVIGHPGEDWGSGCSPCGYNPTYGFGICVAYTSVIGMNCTGDFLENYGAVQEATCRAYDAVLRVVGGPRLNCTVPASSAEREMKNCTWERQPRPERPHGPWPPMRAMVI